MGQGRGCGGSGVFFFSFSFIYKISVRSLLPGSASRAPMGRGGSASPGGAPTWPNLAQTSADGISRERGADGSPGAAAVSRVPCPVSHVPCPVPAGNRAEGLGWLGVGKVLRAPKGVLGPGVGSVAPPSWAGWAGLSPRTAPVLCGGAGAGTRPAGSCGWAAAHLEARSWASRGERGRAFRPASRSCPRTGVPVLPHGSRGASEAELGGVASIPGAPPGSVWPHEGLCRHRDPATLAPSGHAGQGHPAAPGAPRCSRG